jgi:hypothetical protein
MAIDTVVGGSELTLTEILERIEKQHLDAVLTAIMHCKNRTKLYTVEVLRIVEVVERFGVDVGYALTRHKFRADVIYTRDQMDLLVQACRQNGIQINNEDVIVFCEALEEGFVLSERYKDLYR